MASGMRAAIDGAARPPVSARANWFWGVLLAVLGSVLFSGKAVIVKLAYRHGADAYSLIALRMLFALPFFAAAAWWSGRRRPAGEAGTPAGGSPWKKGDAWRIVGTGLCGYYLASFLDFLGLQYVSAGLERVILYLNPTLVLLISLAWFGRRVGAREWVALAVAYAGVIVVFMHDLRVTGRNVPLGAALVFASACSYAVYLVAGGAMVKRLGSIRLTAWASIVSCVACILQSLVIDPAGLVNQAPVVYALSVANALLCTVLPVFIVMMAIERIGSGPASQIGMVGPVATIGMAAVWLGEPVTGTQLVGTAIVLASVFLLSARRA